MIQDPSTPPPSRAPIIETLENGLEVLVLEDHNAPVSSVQIWCRTGSIHEADWIGAGLSHFVEHMLFKGTTKRGLGEIAKGVQERGGYINAYTSFDRTVYWIDTSADGTNDAIDTLIDAASDSLMPAEEVEKEQEVIRREFAMGNDDRGRVLSKSVFSNAFRSHPYRYPVIGHLEIFDQLGRDELIEYYKERYVPNNCFLVVVGAVDADEVIAQARMSSESWQRRALSPVYIPEEPPQVGRRDKHEEFQTPLHHLSLVWQVPAVWDNDVPALDVLASILGSGRSSRLYRSVREEQHLAHSVHAHAYTPGSKGLFMIGADSDPEHRGAIEAALLEQVDQVCSDGVTSAELDKAVKGAVCDHYHTATSMRGQASDIASSWMLTQNPNFSDRYVAGLKSVSPEEVQRVARKYLVEEALSATSLNPIDSLPKGAANGRSKSAENEPEMATLDNGLRVVVRRDTRVPMANAYLSFGGGALIDGYDRAGLSQLLSRTLLKGTETRTAAEIADSIENVGGGIGASAGNNSFGLSVDLLAEDLPMALGIVSDVLENPSFPEEAVAAERDSQIAGIRSELEQPLTLAFWEARRQIFGNRPYAQPLLGTEEMVSGYDTDQLRDLRKSVVGTSNAVLSVVGDVDTESVVQMAQESFSGMSKGSRFLDTVDLECPIPKGGIHELSADKEQAILVMAYPALGSLLDERRYAVDLVDAACSDMASRLFTRIREDLGLAYFIGAGQVHGFAPGMFYFYVGTSADKLDLVQAELRDEISRLATNGLSSEELERARNSTLGRREIGLQSPSSLCQAMALDELYGAGFKAYQSVANRIRGVTVKDTSDACAQLFDGIDPTIVRVIPGDGQGESGS